MADVLSLHFASANGRLEAFNILLQNGSDVTTVDHRDRSALHLALTNQCKEFIQLLIDHGSDIN